MVSKNKIKLIHSLEYKKYRVSENLFLAEGNKLVAEALSSDLHIVALICTHEFRQDAPIGNPDETIIASKEEIRQCSLLKNPQQALAICELPAWPFDFVQLKNNLTLILDGIQDPGNMGTILRIADWFGIKTICASENTVDVFNPKVVQASMGAILRVKVFYTDIIDLIRKANSSMIPTYGAFLNGSNLYREQLPEAALIVVGNEGQGISEEIEKEITNRIFIPPLSFNPGERSESLNVSVATAIICSEFRRAKLSGYSK
jgi:RNA methyltransferase, TrmH family